MASQIFQVSAIGQCPVEIYEAVVQRLSSHCQWAGRFEQEELVYERGVSTNIQSSCLLAEDSLVVPSYLH